MARSLTYTTPDTIVSRIKELSSPVMRATCSAEDLERWIDDDIDDAILLLSRPACRVDVFDETHQMPVATIVAEGTLLKAIHYTN